MEWNQTYGDEVLNRVYSLVETSDGGFELNGSTETFDSDGDFCLVRTDEYCIPEFQSYTLAIASLTMVAVAGIFSKNKLKK